MRRRYIESFKRKSILYRLLPGYKQFPLSVSFPFSASLFVFLKLCMHTLNRNSRIHHFSVEQRFLFVSTQENVRVMRHELPCKSNASMPFCCVVVVFFSIPIMCISTIYRSTVHS